MAARKENSVISKCLKTIALGKYDWYMGSPRDQTVCSCPRCKVMLPTIRNQGLDFNEISVDKKKTKKGFVKEEEFQSQDSCHSNASDVYNEIWKSSLKREKRLSFKRRKRSLSEPSRGFHCENAHLFTKQKTKLEVKAKLGQAEKRTAKSKRKEMSPSLLSENKKCVWKPISKITRTTSGPSGHFAETMYHLQLRENVDNYFVSPNKGTKLKTVFRHGTKLFKFVKQENQKQDEILQGSYFQVLFVLLQKLEKILYHSKEVPKLNRINRLLDCIESTVRCCGKTFLTQRTLILCLEEYEKAPISREKSCFRYLVYTLKFIKRQFNMQNWNRNRVDKESEDEDEITQSQSKSKSQSETELVRFVHKMRACLDSLKIWCERLLREMWAQQILYDQLMGRLSKDLNLEKIENDQNYLIQSTKEYANKLLDFTFQEENVRLLKKKPKPPKTKTKTKTTANVKKEPKEKKQKTFQKTQRTQKAQKAQTKLNLKPKPKPKPKKKKKPNPKIKQELTEKEKTTRKNSQSSTTGSETEEKEEEPESVEEDYEEEEEEEEEQKDEESDLEKYNARKKTSSLSAVALSEKQRRSVLREMQSQNTTAAMQLSRHFRSLNLPLHRDRPPNYNKNWHTRMQHLLEDLNETITQVCDKARIPVSEDTLSRFHSYVEHLEKKK